MGQGMADPSVLGRDQKQPGIEAAKKLLVGLLRFLDFEKARDAQLPPFSQ